MANFSLLFFLDLAPRGFLTEGRTPYPPYSPDLGQRRRFNSLQ